MKLKILFICDMGVLWVKWLLWVRFIVKIVLFGFRSLKYIVWFMGDFESG